MASKRSLVEVPLANLSMRVLNFVSMWLFPLRNPIKYLQVSLRALQRVVFVSTFDGSSRLLADCVGVTSIGLCQVKKSVDCLLVCSSSVSVLKYAIVYLTIRMSLNLNHELLQAPDGLFTALFGHLAGKVLLHALLLYASSVTGVAGLLLVLLGHVLIGAVLESGCGSLSTGCSCSLGVDVGGLSSCIGGISGIARATWVDVLASITNSILTVEGQ